MLRQCTGRRSPGHGMRKQLASCLAEMTSSLCHPCSTGAPANTSCHPLYQLLAALLRELGFAAWQSPTIKTFTCLPTGQSNNQIEAYHGRLATQGTEQTCCSPGRKHRGKNIAASHDAVHAWSHGSMLSPVACSALGQVVCSCCTTYAAKAYRDGMWDCACRPFA